MGGGEHLNVRPPNIYVHRYRNSVTHGIIWPLDVLIYTAVCSGVGICTAEVKSVPWSSHRTDECTSIPRQIRSRPRKGRRIWLSRYIQDHKTVKPLPRQSACIEARQPTLGVHSHLSSGVAGSVRSRHQTVSDHVNEKIVLPSILTQVFHSSWCETCRVIQQQFWIKECDILQGDGSKHTLTPTYFQLVKTPKPPVSTFLHLSVYRYTDELQSYTLKCGGMHWLLLYSSTVVQLPFNYTSTALRPDRETQGVDLGFGVLHVASASSLTVLYIHLYSL